LLNKHVFYKKIAKIIIIKVYYTRHNYFNITRDIKNFIIIFLFTAKISNESKSQRK